MSLKFPDIDPIIMHIYGPLAISWYSLSYIAGILLGFFYINKLIDKNQNLGITKQHFEDFFSYAVIGIIVGGRLGYVIFYDFDRYIQDPISILKTYEGGMSFHGGITGLTLSAILFSKSRNISSLRIFDYCANAAPIGLFFGRIANFINAELYGKVTDVPWAFIFPGSDGNPRHPSQLYESFLEGFILFWILYYTTNKLNFLQKKGLSAGLFLIFYGIFRMFIEFFREPDEQIGYVASYFSMGQILCIPMILLGTVLILYSRKKCQ